PVFSSCAASGSLYSASSGIPLARGRRLLGGETMNRHGLATLHNGQAIPRAQIPQVPFERFRQTILDAAFAGQRVVALFGAASASQDSVDLYAVLADSTRALLRVDKTTIDSDNFPSLTPECPQVHL